MLSSLFQRGSNVAGRTGGINGLRYFGTTKQEAAVSLHKNVNYDLFYVENVDHIDDGPIIRKETLNDCMQLTNNVGMCVTAMKRGGCMTQINKNGNDYLWRNKEGACYYGPNSNSFPLQRGLQLHGGVR